jgi:hypothetical protein
MRSLERELAPYDQAAPASAAAAVDVVTERGPPRRRSARAPAPERGSAARWFWLAYLTSDRGVILALAALVALVSSTYFVDDSAFGSRGPTRE